MHLMVHHILIFAVLDNHFQHPFHFPPCFVQKIGIGIVLLRKMHCAVCIGRLSSIFHGALILVLHHPKGNAAINNIFAVISGIIPATGYVLCAAIAL